MIEVAVVAVEARGAVFPLLYASLFLQCWFDAVDHRWGSIQLVHMNYVRMQEWWKRNHRAHRAVVDVDVGAIRMDNEAD